MAGVFISYRRADSGGRSGRLYEHLSKRFPHTPIFLDFEDIPPGADFPEVIRAAIRTSDVVLVIIGPLWLKGADGQRRLDDPRDQLRHEIVEAARSKRTIIPVLVGGARMPSEEDLPQPLRFLAYRNALELSDSRWNYDISRLNALLQKRLAAGSTSRPADKDLAAQDTPDAKRARAHSQTLVRALSVLLSVLGVAIVVLIMMWIRGTDGSLSLWPCRGGQPTPMPIYESGLITYISTDEDQRTLSILQNDGTSTVLARGADVRVLAVSPDQCYLVAATSPEDEFPSVRPGSAASRFLEGSDLSVTVLSTDGQISNTLIAGGYGVNAAYLADGRLLVASRSADRTTITYTLALADGSQPIPLYLSEDLSN